MRLNHALLLASDINQMAQFLVQTIGLKEGKRPAFGFDGIWLYDEVNTPCIHIAGRHEINSEQSNYLGSSQSSNEYKSQPIVDHLAFSLADYKGLIARLHTLGVPYFEREVPEANEHQVFFTAPDDLKIEILFIRDEFIKEEN